MSAVQSLHWAVGDLIAEVESLQVKIKALENELDQANREIRYLEDLRDKTDERLHKAWQTIEDLGLGLDPIMPASQPEGMNDHIWELLLKTRAYDDIPF